MMNILEQMRAKSQKKEIGEEDKDVVKGTARRVIVVRSPDPNVFEEAIFLVKEDYMRSPGVTQTQLLDEARRAAAGYVGRVSAAKKKSRLPLYIAASGLGGSGIAVALISEERRVRKECRSRWPPYH